MARICMCAIDRRPRRAERRCRGRPRRCCGPGRFLDALEDWGLYSQLVWNIDKRWEVGARGERVEGVQDDPLDPEWVKPRRRTTVQWTFYPSHFSRLRLQGSRDEPPWRKDPTHAVFLALEVLIGAHGAHTF